MKLHQKKWKEKTGWIDYLTLNEKFNAHLVLAFGDRSLISDTGRFEELKAFYPNAHILLASTSGNIMGTDVDDLSIVVTAISFETPVELKISNINILKNAIDCFKAGEFLGKSLQSEGLAHIFLVSDGHFVNGSALVKGLLSCLPPQVAITGGLAGDGSHFKKTVVGIDESPQEGEIVAIGFYGQYLHFGFGSYGGWDPFGIERKITRSDKNILFELDEKSALDIYKTYLGKKAKELPASALLFPLAIRPDLKSKSIVRTILSINENEKSMIFAGDVPEGWYAQLMMANVDRLIDGAAKAASSSYEMLGRRVPDLAILISCVGRKLVLGPYTEDEVEGIQEILGKKAVLTGFYSYGEMAPTALHSNCELHNQTMTITTISEY